MGYEVPDNVNLWIEEGAVADRNAAFQREERESMLIRPSYMLHPRLFRDGNQWCALLGTDLQKGVVGFGNSPELAYVAFDKAWTSETNQK